ncbi:MAG TPA: alkaline phosphatase family protein, partial [Bryobacteraceae bacterium]|nr:alkaline phosphatase family protein [Bryobacteraceae bacterium]
MRRAFLSIIGLAVCLAPLSLAPLCAQQLPAPNRSPDIAKRVVLIKVDGLPEDLLEKHLDDLPWIRRIFVERGAWVRNFYVRGISLSAPSWQMLDSGQHMLIRGNADFDRFTGHVYDYLNFFPFYVGYARSQRTDMPAVEVLDQAGVPLVADNFSPDEVYRGMQLYQRGVRWKTLAGSLRDKMALPVKDLIDEWQTGFNLSDGIADREEKELIAALANPRILYLDYFTGDIDHTLHLTNDPASQLSALRRLDATIGRIWTAIEVSPLASSTVLVLVSDHGMNSDPKVYSQGYNLVRFFNSAAGGAHHVISTRHPLSEYKLRGLDPFVSSVVTPSLDSFYLKDQKDWATALLDLDGNERTSIQLRNSDVNEIQILMQELPHTRHRDAVSAGILRIIDRNRAEWTRTADEIAEEVEALGRAIERARVLEKEHRKDKSEEARRRLAILDTWKKDERGYTDYARALRSLLDLKASGLEGSRPQFPVPQDVLGESNTLAQLENYSVGLSREGLTINEDGSLDLDDSFTRINYLRALSNIRVRNVVQPGLGDKPVDFIAARAKDGVFLYGDPQHSALILSRMQDGQLWLRYVPVCDPDMTPAPWGAGFPLHLFEDPDLQVSGDRTAWLSDWHSEREWFDAVHRTHYSNAIIGLEEYFAPWQPDSVP